MTTVMRWFGAIFRAWLVRLGPHSRCEPTVVDGGVPRRGGVSGLSLVLVAACEFGWGDGVALGVEEAHGVFGE